MTAVERDDPVPPALNVDVIFEDPRWQDIPDAEETVIRAARAAFASHGTQAAETELAVLLTGDDALHEMNRRWRGKDMPTNVLSFPADDVARAMGHLGDIALSCDTLAREAAADAKPLTHHMQHLVIHGVLHLLGFDHMTETQADAMEALERAILAGLGVPDPYATSGAAAGQAAPAGEQAP